MTMMNDRSIDWYIEKLTDTSTRGLARDMAHLIRCGEIPLGSKLPAVRDLAEAMGVSPATISAAWSQLRRFQVINGRGRNGVWVTGDKASLRPVRFETEIAGSFGDRIIANLTLAPPDVNLLPVLNQALMHGTQVLRLNSYDREPITENLARVVESRWPYHPESYLALNGGIEAVYTVLRTLVMPGTMVAIENPTATRLLDILEGLGANIVPVSCDAHGPTPLSLRSALQAGAAIFIFQPRTNTTTGHVVTPIRLEALASELRSYQTLIIEDDGLGDLSAAPPASIGKWLPLRTVHIISYSKSLGPDLRVAVLSCTGEIAQQIRSIRNFGASWTSRILQDAVAFLLEDPATNEMIVEARSAYHTRRLRLVDELSLRGVEVSGIDGLSVWLHVPDEQTALVNMALRGFPVLGGSQFSLNLPDHYIRVATSRLSDHYEQIAEAIKICVSLGNGKEGRRF